jgi:E3 ubiquitin-protein ligase TRIP12
LVLDGELNCNKPRSKVSPLTSFINISLPQVLRDDSLPVCMPEKVHDVKLGAASEDSNVAPPASDSQSNPASGSSSRAVAVRGSDSTDFRSGSSYGSRGAMSFAAAAMAGLGSANGRGIRGGRDRQGRPLFGSSSDPPKLIFTAAGKQLNRHLTIYQAIQRQLVLEEDDEDRYGGRDFISSDGSRLWSDIYTLTYQGQMAKLIGLLLGAQVLVHQSLSKVALPIQTQIPKCTACHF